MSLRKPVATRRLWRWLGWAAAGIGTVVLAVLAWLLAPMPGPSLATPSSAGWRQSPPLVLVLGAGGPRGFAHIGVLKALEELQIRPDAIVGASAGALAGALWSSGLNAADIERRAAQLTALSLADLAWDGSLRLRGARYANWVRAQTGVDTLESLPLPLAVAATHEATASTTLFTRGDLGAAIRASSATPSLFAPVTLDGIRYVDADQSSPVPVAAARALGARYVIAVDVSAHADATPADIPERWREGDRLMRQRVDTQTPLADVLIHPDLGYYAGASASYRAMAIERGYRATLAQAGALRALLARARP